MAPTKPTITDLPLEIHHQIGSYFTIRELKTVSLVCWDLFEFYSYPLAKKTKIKLHKYLKKTKKGYVPLNRLPFRRLLCNIRMKASMMKAARDLDIDRDCVRGVEIKLDKEFSENIYETFPKLRSIIFITPEQIVVKWSTENRTLHLPKDTKLMKRVIGDFKNFEHILLRGEDLEDMRQVLDNSASTLKVLKIRGDFEQEEIARILPKDLIPDTLIFDCPGRGDDNMSPPLPIFSKVQNFSLELDFANYFSDYFWNLFGYLTQLSFVFDEDFTSTLVFQPQHLEKNWYLPKLKVFKTNYCGVHFIEKMDAPVLERLELYNMYNTYTILALKRFQSISYVHIASHKDSFLKLAIEFFAENFKRLETIHIEQQYVVDDDSLGMVLEKFTKLKIKPANENFKTLKFIGVYIYGEHPRMPEIELDGFDFEVYPHMKRWIGDVSGFKVQMIFHVFRRKLKDLNFQLPICI